METYPDAMDLYEAMEKDYEIISLPNNLMMARIKHHKESKTKKSKALSLLVCCRFFHNIHSHHVIKINKGDMGLSQDGIRGR